MITDLIADITKVGMYGVEKDDSKENETDCVWVGNCTNRASKYSDLADGGEIFISENVYNRLSSDLKPENVWIPAAKHKANVLFNGYISQNNYLEFSSELGLSQIIKVLGVKIDSSAEDGLDGDSKIFFEHIQKSNYLGYKDKLLATTEEAFLNDVISQIYINWIDGGMKE